MTDCLEEEASYRGQNIASYFPWAKIVDRLSSSCICHSLFCLYVDSYFQVKTLKMAKKNFKG